MADVKMGKALIRAKKKRQLTNRANFQAILDQEHRNQIAQETAPKLQSVWQTTNLDDVLEAAGEREDGYAALRDVRVVVGGAVHVVAGDKVVPQVSADANTDRDWHKLSDKLPIPERPKWSFRMKADEVQQQEKSAFVEWRRELARIEESDKVLMTPFEKNLEVWRQLWRVVEKSDIVLEIVDARNPLAFRSAGFERYVAKHNTRSGKPKSCILILNKADLLTENQRRAWAASLQARGIRFFFFSARASTEAQNAAAAELAKQVEGANADEEEQESGDDAPSAPQAHHRDPRQAGGPMLEEERFQAEVLRRAAEAKAAAQPKKERRRRDKQTKGAPTRVENPYALKSLKDEAEERKKQRQAEAAKPRPLTQEEIDRDKRLAADVQSRFQPHDVLDPIALLDALSVLRADLGVQAEEPIMVGLTGYPNVGKSSTINAIMQSKKVVVSATPGKTKHFQTLQIPNERRLMLCDCPGLVFPSFASTKEAMVCDGVLPVDTCRDYLAAVAVVCDRVPRGVLERTYNVLLERDLDVDESATRAEFFLNALSRRKGFMTEHDKPNRYRSAHIVLKDYVDGKVVFVHAPPELRLEDPTPEVAPKASGKQPKPAPKAAAAAAGANDDEGWETASGSDGEEEAEGEWETDDEAGDEAWEDISNAEGGRHLSDAGDSEISDDGPEPLTFYGATVPGKTRRMTTAEVFNMERNLEIIDAPEEAPRHRRKKVNHMLVPDETVRVNRHGEKELLLDDDDEIVICAEETKKEKKPSKRTQRRREKQGVMAARGAKPAALPGMYDARTGEVGAAAQPQADF